MCTVGGREGYQRLPMSGQGLKSLVTFVIHWVVHCTAVAGMGDS
jgi:hypothetical protein